MLLLPKNIDTSNPHAFGGSGFRNSECETIARNVVMLQQSLNPEAWTDFSWEQYREFCQHKVSNSERGVLEAMVKGGKPVWNTSAHLQSGYLEKHGDNYRITKKFLDALPRGLIQA